MQRAGRRVCAQECRGSSDPLLPGFQLVQQQQKKKEKKKKKAQPSPAADPCHRRASPCLQRARLGRSCPAPGRAAAGCGLRARPAGQPASGVSRRGGLRAGGSRSRSRCSRLASGGAAGQLPRPSRAPGAAGELRPGHGHSAGAAGSGSGSQPAGPGEGGGSSAAGSGGSRCASGPGVPQREGVRPPPRQGRVQPLLPQPRPAGGLWQEDGQSPWGDPAWSLK